MTDPSFAIEAKPFRDLIARVEPATKSTYVGPLIDLHAEGNLLTASADDFSLGISATVSCVCEGEVRILVAADALKTVLAGCSGEVRCIPSAKPRGLAITAEGLTAHVGGPADDLRRQEPVEPKPDTALIDGQALKRALARVEHAVKPQDVRPFCTGVRLHAVDGVLGCSGFDGFSFGHALAGEVQGEAIGLPAGGWIVPLPAAKALIGLIEDGEVVELAPAVTGNRVVVAGGDWNLSSVVIDGGYPDWTPWNRRDLPTRVTVARADLLAATTLAAGMAHAHDGAKQLTLGVGDGAVVVTGADAERGRVVRTVAADVEGPGVETIIDARYMRGMLGAAGSERVTLGFEAEPGTPIVLREEPDGGDVWITAGMVPRRL